MRFRLFVGDPRGMPTQRRAAFEHRFHCLRFRASTVRQHEIPPPRPRGEVRLQALSSASTKRGQALRDLGACCNPARGSCRAPRAGRPCRRRCRAARWSSGPWDPAEARGGAERSDPRRASRRPAPERDDGTSFRVQVQLSSRFIRLRTELINEHDEAMRLEAAGAAQPLLTSPRKIAQQMVGTLHRHDARRAPRRHPAARCPRERASELVDDHGAHSAEERLRGRRAATALSLAHPGGDARALLAGSVDAGAGPVGWEAYRASTRPRSSRSTRASSRGMSQLLAATSARSTAPVLSDQTASRSTGLRRARSASGLCPRSRSVRRALDLEEHVLRKTSRSSHCGHPAPDAAYRLCAQGAHGHAPSSSRTTAVCSSSPTATASDCTGSTCR